MPELSLYYKPTCPFCRKVLDFMSGQKITLPLKNLDDSTDARQQLIKIGGKAQIPCLVIGGKALYESDAIIAWLEENPNASS